MGIKTTVIKCKNCGAAQEVESGRNEFFCTYCGARNIITNENEYIYRHVDDAEIKQAETEQMVRMKEMEMKEKELEVPKKRRRNGIIAIIVLAILTAIFFMVGFVIEGTAYDNLSTLFAWFGAFSLFAIIFVWVSIFL